MKYEEIVKKKFEELKTKKEVIVVGIETSCDETSVAVVKNGREVLSNVIASQIEIHKRFGGVVPEVASRNHISAIDKIFQEAVSRAGITLRDIDAVAVTYGAGLIGALLVGVNFAKSLAYNLEIPLIAVSHINGHIFSNFLTYKELCPPFVCLLISGGHTAILKVDDYFSHSLLGTTVDDAVGEAFDKVARILGLEYPGGPVIDRLAKQGEAKYEFVKSSSLKNSYNMSFSGIKTAILNFVHKRKQNGEEIDVENICASFQSFVTEELSSRAIRACLETGLKKLVAAGGVSANSFLKQSLKEKCEKEKIELFMPELKFCTDNAAMIASAGYFQILKNIGLSNLQLEAKSTIPL